MTGRPNPDPAAQLVLLLAGVAGYTDAVGYLRLRHLFTAHMTGNTVKLGVALAHGDLSRAAPLALAPLLFVAGIAAGTVLADTGRRALALALQAALLAVFMAVGAEANPFYALECAAILALGLQTAAITELNGRTMRTTYISGVLTNLAQESVRRLRGRNAKGHPLGLLAGVWLAYAVAATLGAYLKGELSLWCLALPLAVLCVAALVERRRRDSNPRGRDFPT